MNLLILIIIIFLSLVLFLSMNYLSEEKINRIDTIIIPNISMIIVASIFTKLKNYMILFLIFYLVIDFIYTFLISKKNLIIDNKNYYVNSILTLVLGIIIYEFFLLKVEYSYVDMEVFKNFIWVMIILYFYNKFNLKSIKLDKNEQDNFDIRFKEFVIISYARLKNKYGYLIKTNEDIENLLYSFMVYEIYKKNTNVILKIKDKITNKNKYGIFNIKSDHKRTYEESIVMMLEKIENKNKRIKNKEDRIEKIIKDNYKNEEYTEIIKIFDIIKNFK